MAPEANALPIVHDEMSFYYDPFHHSLNIKNSSGKIGLEIFDITGNLRFTKDLDGEESVSLNEHTFYPGIYIVRMNIGIRQLTGKIIIQN